MIIKRRVYFQLLNQQNHKVVIKMQNPLVIDMHRSNFHQTFYIGRPLCLTRVYTHWKTESSYLSIFITFLAFYIHFLMANYS